MLKGAEKRTGHQQTHLQACHCQQFQHHLKGNAQLRPYRTNRAGSDQREAGAEITASPVAVADAQGPAQTRVPL